MCKPIDGNHSTFTLLLTDIEESIAKCIDLLGGDVEPDHDHKERVRRIAVSADNLQLLVQNSIRRRGKREQMSETEGHADA